MNTTETATSAIALEVAPFACDAASVIYSNKGRALGRRYLFTGTQDAKSIRASLKAAGKKGKSLDVAVNECLRGHSTVAQQLAHAFVVDQCNRGVVWTVAESRNKGATLKGILAPDATPAKPVNVSEAAAALSDADKLALIASLTASLAPATTVLEA